MEEILKGFKDYKTKIEGKSEDTIDQYIYRLEDFFNYNKIKNKKDFLSIKAINVKEWLSSLADKGNSERSRNIKLTAVKEIYKYVKNELKENIDEDVLNIPFAKVPHRESKYLDREVANDLLAFTRDIRVKTGMAIIFATGVRFCELVQITCNDIENGYATIIGKGNKERQIFFPLWVQEIAKQFIKTRRKTIVEKNGDKYNGILMINDRGNIVARKNFEASMKCWARRFNEHPLHYGELDWWRHFSPHKLRHSFATEQLRKGNDIGTVRDELGHANIVTTNNYTHSSKERVRMAMLGEDTKEEDEMMNLFKKMMKDENLKNKFKQMIEEEEEEETEEYDEFDEEYDEFDEYNEELGDEDFE